MHSQIWTGGCYRSGRIVMPVTEIPNMVMMAMFADPEGNTIGLIKAAAPPPRKPRKTRKAKK